MVAINFTMFADKVWDGVKRQTIRSTTKAYPGCLLQLYEGMRTKHCQKIFEAKCKSVTPIKLSPTAAYIHGSIIIGLALEALARADGFDTYIDMWAFFSKRAGDDGNYRGNLIKW